MDRVAHDGCATGELVAEQHDEMVGYPYSPAGYPSNFQIGLATAVSAGLPGAETAWSIFESRSVKPKPPMGYNNYPNFAIVPRTLPAQGGKSDNAH